MYQIRHSILYWVGKGTSIDSVLIAGYLRKTDNCNNDLSPFLQVLPAARDVLPPDMCICRPRSAKLTPG
jgi:hypothetical protein